MTQDSTLVDVVTVTPVIRFEVFAFAQDYAVVLGIAFVLLGFAAVVTQGQWKNSALFVLLPSVALGFAGLTIGILAGNSLTPLANAALSGFVSIASGFIVYLVSKEDLLPWTRTAGGISLTCLAIAIVYGASVGAAFRARAERAETVWKVGLEQRSKTFDSRLSVWEYAQKKQIDVSGDSATKANSR